MGVGCTHVRLCDVYRSVAEEQVRLLLIIIHATTRCDARLFGLERAEEVEDARKQLRLGVDVRADCGQRRVQLSAGDAHGGERAVETRGADEVDDRTHRLFRGWSCKIMRPDEAPPGATHSTYLPLVLCHEHHAQRDQLAMHEAAASELFDCARQVMLRPTVERALASRKEWVPFR